MNTNFLSCILLSPRIRKDDLMCTFCDLLENDSFSNGFEIDIGTLFLNNLFVSFENQLISKIERKLIDRYG